MLVGCGDHDAQAGRHRTAVQHIGLHSLSFVVLSAAPQFWIWQSLDPATWALLSVIALCGVGAQFLIITAYTKASPPTLAPFEYSALIWASCLGYVLWRDIPATNALIGAVIIASSGLYIVHREARLRGASARFQKTAKPVKTQ